MRKDYMPRPDDDFDGNVFRIPDEVRSYEVSNDGRRIVQRRESRPILVAVLSTIAVTGIILSAYLGYRAAEKLRDTVRPGVEEVRQPEESLNPIVDIIPA